MVIDLISGELPCTIIVGEASENRLVTGVKDDVAGFCRWCAGRRLVSRTTHQ